MPPAANNSTPRPKTRLRRKVAGAAHRSAGGAADSAADPGEQDGADGASRSGETGHIGESGHIGEPDHVNDSARANESGEAGGQVDLDEQSGDEQSGDEWDEGPGETAAVPPGQERGESAVPEGGCEELQGPDRRTVATRVLLGVLAVCVLVAGWFGVSFYTLANGSTTGNTALSDPAATRQVAGQVAEAVQTSFTYDYANPQRTEQEAGKVLTGSAIRQYQQLFGQVKQVAPAQKLVFNSHVRSAGVQELRGDRARVLLFVDQQGVRADTNQRRSGSAQLDVTAQRVGDAWKVSEIRVL